MISTVCFFFFVIEAKKQTNKKTKNKRNKKKESRYFTGVSDGLQSSLANVKKRGK